MNEFLSNDEHDKQLSAELDRLFPNGPAGSDVLRELVPDGLEQSPLRAAYHPTLDQVFEESVRLHENLNSLPWRDPNKPSSPPPTREEIEREYCETPVDTNRELHDIVGKCLWDLVSDNHDVVDAEGREIDFGSFRYAGGVIADWLNDRLGPSVYDYMDFYMGTIWLSGRADFAPVYGMIFRRMKRLGWDWVYHFPRMHLVDFGPLREALKDKDQPDWEGYDPSAEFAKAQAEEERQQELAKMRQSLDDGYRESITEALRLPPPKTVQAYQSVFGKLPQGWPPSAEED
ncbi:MAG TPA: hypothetical protein VK137_03365 [Planctomycetaceae bacterium]|nr:hypothetical protein [Planctomycetaceae bacterium]